MAKELREGQLGSIIRSSGNKLVAVDFSNPGCPPCRAIKPWWDSLPKKYPSVEFCTVMCQDCPGDASSNNVSATPTFIFFLKGSEISRILGPDKSKILAVIEKHKNAAPSFTGKARTIGDSPTAPNNNNNNNNSKPIFQAKTASQKPKQQFLQSTIGNDNFAQNMLLEMGFPIEKVRKAINATKGGSVDQCVLYLEKLQNESESTNETTTQELISMGFDPAIIQAAIERVGSSSIEECLNAIDQIRNQNSNNNNNNNYNDDDDEDEEAKMEKLKARLKEKKEEEPNPQSDSNETKKKVVSEFEERSIREIRERKEILNQIKRQHPNINNSDNNNNNEKAVPQRVQSADSANTRKECTLKLVLPDGESVVNTFQSTDSLQAVAAFVTQSVAEARGKNLAFETMFPKRVITAELFDSTLAECQLVPRAQIRVLYL